MKSKIEYSRDALSGIHHRVPEARHNFYEKRAI